jgi:virginiamycin B lyase
MLLERLKKLNSLDDKLAAWLARVGSSSSLVTALVLTAVLAGNVLLLVLSPGPALTALVEVGPVIATGLGFVSNGTTWYGWFRVARRRDRYGVKDFAKDKALDVPGQVQGLPGQLQDAAGQLDTRVTEASRSFGCLGMVSASLLVAAVVVAGATYAPPPFQILGAAPAPHATPVASTTQATVLPTETALPTATAQPSPTATRVPFVATTFALPAGAQPVGVTAGPDGNVWFTEPGLGQIGRITPGGQITQFTLPRSGSSPLIITRGPDNNLWYTDNVSSMVGRLTPTGQFTEFSLAAGRAPEGIVAGPDGNLWVCESGSGRIARVTTSGAITEFTLPSDTNPQATLITTGPMLQTANGPAPALWFTEASITAVGAITMSGAITQFSLSSQYTALGAVRPQPFGIAAGNDGHLWVTAPTVHGVLSVAPSGQPVTGYPLPDQQGAPRGIVAGPDGNLWMADSGNNTLDRVTTAGVVTKYPIGSAAEGLPLLLAVGADGNLWVTLRGASVIVRFTL